jgi:hypothetical protein
MALRPTFRQSKYAADNVSFSTSPRKAVGKGHLQINSVLAI